MIKNNLDAISLMEHSLQDISTMRRQRIKLFLNRTCVSLSDLEYTDTQQTFWEEINKSLNRAKDVGNLEKEMFPETSRSIKSSFQPFPKTRTHDRNSFLYKSPTTKGNPQQVQESLDKILQDLQNQVHHYIRLVLTIRKFL